MYIPDQYRFMLVWTLSPFFFPHHSHCHVLPPSSLTPDDELLVFLLFCFKLIPLTMFNEIVAFYSSFLFYEDLTMLEILKI